MGSVGGTCGKFFGRDSASPLPGASVPGQGFQAPTSLFQVKQHKHQQYQYQVHDQHQNKYLALFLLRELQVNLLLNILQASNTLPQPMASMPEVGQSQAEENMPTAVF